jgi:hypothetical protein
LTTGTFEADDAFRLHYVGGTLDQQPIGNALHKIAIKNPSDNQWRYIVIRIRLFAKFGGPVYRIVAGRRFNPNKPVSILLEEASALRTYDRTIFGSPSYFSIPEGLWDPNAPSSDKASPTMLPRYIRGAAGSRQQ